MDDETEKIKFTSKRKFAFTNSHFMLMSDTRNFILFRTKALRRTE